MVPIVDLRVRFNLTDTSTDDNAVIILVKIAIKGGERTIGIVVDAVADVYAINQEDISETPDLAFNMVKQFVTGFATIDDKMIIMLDIDALISTGVLDEDALVDGPVEV